MINRQAFSSHIQDAGDAQAVTRWSVTGTLKRLGAYVRRCLWLAGTFFQGTDTVPMVIQLPKV